MADKLVKATQTLQEALDSQVEVEIKIAWT